MGAYRQTQTRQATSRTASPSTSPGFGCQAATTQASTEPIGRPHRSPIGGKELWVEDYDVWTGRLSDNTPGFWKAFAPGIEREAVHVGTEDPLWPLYAARAFHEGGRQLGKWRRDWTAASFPYGGAEIWLTTFEILVPGTQID